MQLRSFWLCCIVAATTAAAACSGQIAGPGSIDSGGGGTGAVSGGGIPGDTEGPGFGGGGGANAEIPVSAPEMRPLVRLSNEELEYALIDLFQGVVDAHEIGSPDAVLPPDSAGESGFHLPLTAAPLYVDRLLGFTAELAEQAIDRWDRLFDCGNRDEHECAAAFVADFGRRAYRRNLTSAEQDDLVALYNNARDQLEYDFQGGVRVVLNAILMAPRFLYHWELGETAAVAQDGAIVLNDHELASRLSFYLWRSIPDQDLLAAADDARLGTVDEIRGQVQRMLADPKARRGVRSFFLQWMDVWNLPDLDRDTGVFPMWSDSLKVGMVGEIEALVEHVVFDGGGNLETLLTTNRSFVTAELAQLYGASNPQDPDVATTLHADQRAGLFTTAGWLTVHYSVSDSTPIIRGKLLRQHVLCDSVPEPPPGAGDELPDVAPDATLRERLAAHRVSPLCSSCHELMDPLGFAFHGYDAIGRVRYEEAPGVPIDASGMATDLDDGQTVAFSDAVGLARILAKQRKVHDCFASEVLRFSLGRALSRGDEGTLHDSARRFVGTDLDIAALIADVATSYAIRHRAPADEEVLQ